MPFDNPPKDSPAVADREMLRRIRASLSPRGAWCKGKYRSLRGDGRCLVGWISFHIGGTDTPEHEATHLFVSRVFGVSPVSLVTFNDSDRTRKHEVLSLIDHAMSKLVEG